METIIKKIEMSLKDQMIYEMALFDYHLEKIENGESDYLILHFTRDDSDKAYIKELKKLEKQYFFEAKPKIWPLVLFTAIAIILLTILLVLALTLKPNFPIYLYFVLGLPALLSMTLATIYSYLHIKGIKNQIDDPKKHKEGILKQLSILKKDFNK